MALLAYVDAKGEIKYTETDVGQALVDVPAPLESINTEQLRYNGTAIVDASLQSDFFIDDNGEKWLINDAVDALAVTGTFTLNRRGGPNDAIQRTTGSWVTDGFTVGSFVSVEGSTGADLVYKVIAVSALDLEFDESVTRIPADENNVSITVHQGWQRIEGLDFNDVMQQDADGLWSAKTDNQNRLDSVAAFEAEVLSLVNQHVTTQSPYPDRHRQPPEARVAAARIIKVGKDEVPPFVGTDLAVDTVVIADDIYDQNTGTETLTCSFVATGKQITRSAGDFRTQFDQGMSIVVTGSVDNDATYTVIGFANNGLTMRLGSTGRNLTDETDTASVQIDGTYTITGYEDWRNEDTPGVVGKDQWRRFMEEAVAEQWFAKLETRRKNYVKDADNAAIWAGTTSYAVDDYVWDPASRGFFKCNTAHTSQAALDDDQSKWDAYLAEDIVLSAYPTAQIAS